MNSLEETKKCERAATDVNMIASVRFAVLKKQLTSKQANGYSEKCNCSTQFNETALKVVCDAIHHSVEYSNSVSEMESFRDELQSTVDKLSCLISRWNEGEERMHICRHEDIAQH